MNSTPKIFVFKMREIIYTLLLLSMIILLIVFLILMFSGKSHPAGNPSQTQTGTAQNNSSQAQSGTAQDDSSQAQSGTAQDDSSQAQSGTAQNDSSQAQSGAAAQNGETVRTTSAGTDNGQENTYTAGVYTSSITLGESNIDVEVTVNSDQIRAIRLVNLSEATAAAYPLVSIPLDNIAAQILEKQKLDGITCSSENRYTSQLLLNAVSNALSLARNAD